MPHMTSPCLLVCWLLWSEQRSSIWVDCSNVALLWLCWAWILEVQSVLVPSVSGNSQQPRLDFSKKVSSPVGQFWDKVVISHLQLQDLCVYWPVGCGPVYSLVWAVIGTYSGVSSKWMHGNLNVIQVCVLLNWIELNLFIYIALLYWLHILGRFTM